jgi:toxin ParE1/3/4
MKVIYTDEALRDLSEIAAYVAERYPNIAQDVERLMRAIVNRIERWPESAPEVTDRPNVHAVALVHYPYKLFYRIARDSVEILYIHHASRAPR